MQILYSRYVSQLCLALQMFLFVVCWMSVELSVTTGLIVIYLFTSQLVVLDSKKLQYSVARHFAKDG